MVRTAGGGQHLSETHLFRPISAAPSHGPEPSLAPHRISLRLRLGCDSPSRGE